MNVQKKIWLISCLLISLLISGCHIERVSDHDAKIKEQETQTKDFITVENKKTEEQNKETETSPSEKSETDEATSKQEPSEGSSSTAKQSTPPSSSSNSSTPSSKPVDPQEPAQTTPEPAPAPEQKTSYATISIDVKTILSNMDQLKENKRSYVPSDGWILKPTKIELQEGDTVFSVLERVTRRNRIVMEYQGASTNAYNTVYIQGIQQLYEFDCGNLSGWMYFVNGSYVSVGASAKSVCDGDVIEWRFTCNSGNDLR